MAPQSLRGIMIRKRLKEVEKEIIYIVKCRNSFYIFEEYCRVGMK